VGTSGCGFEQQLEAVYKAVAPKSVEFAGNTNGHADDDNKGFLRPEAVLALILVSDEEDCSVTSKGEVMFNDQTNDPGVKLPGSSMNLGLNIRCAYTDNPDGRETQAEKNGFVYDVDRYVTEFKMKVKPLNPDRIIFAAIVGIAEETEGKSFDDMLNHPRMDFALDSTTGGGDPTNRNTAAKDVCRRCNVASQAECFAKAPNLPDGKPDPDLVTGAKPAVRFVKVAKGYGENGVTSRSVPIATARRSTPSSRRSPSSSPALACRAS